MNTKANNGFANNGSNNILELLNAHTTKGAGFRSVAGRGTKPSIVIRTTTSIRVQQRRRRRRGCRRLRCARRERDRRTTIKGCRSWWNSDDGYDFLSDESPVTITNSWAMGAGYSNYVPAREEMAMASRSAAARPASGTPS